MNTEDKAYFNMANGTYYLYDTKVLRVDDTHQLVQYPTPSEMYATKRRIAIALYYAEDDAIKRRIKRWRRGKNIITEERLIGDNPLLLPDVSIFEYEVCLVEYDYLLHAFIRPSSDFETPYDPNVEERKWNLLTQLQPPIIANIRPEDIVYGARIYYDTTLVVGNEIVIRESPRKILRFCLVDGRYYVYHKKKYIPLDYCYAGII